MAPPAWTRAVAGVAGLLVCLVVATPVAAAANAPEPGEAAPEVTDPDPWEPMNRGIFWFNETADIYVVAPVARGWRFVVPGFARKAIDNFNGLLLMPVVLANGILQLKPKNAAQDFGRIVYNATFGLGGLIDVATMIDIPQNDEDFGQTLGYWGVPAGPYLVLPVFGPSNIRDGVGRLGDAAGTFYFSFLPFWSTFIVRGVELINLRARYLEEVEENRREAFDYYVFLRNAYLQNRRARIGRARGEEVVVEDVEGDLYQEDLYYYDDDEEEWDADGDENEDEHEESGEGGEAPDAGASDGEGDRAQDDPDGRP
jgi:phospholipid-binding lipoprotein MlaA